MNTSRTHLKKAPSQARSQRTVERILAAARRLLKASGESAPLKISTNHIAREAGLSVGSLYQYFPNTEAILLEVHWRMVEPIQSLMRAFDTHECLALPRGEFFENLFTSATQSEADNDILYAMHGTGKLYPALIEADRAHAEVIAGYLAKFLRHHGSNWPPARLERMGLYIYYIDAGTWRYRDHARPGGGEARQWEVGLLMSLIEQCWVQKRCQLD